MLRAAPVAVSNSGPSRVILSLLSALGAGCSTDDGLTVVNVDPTIVEVTPQAFLGDLPCAEGALSTYVATLIDLTPNAVPEDPQAPPQERPLPSSAPAPCTRSIVFGTNDTTAADEGRVVAGHAYAAEIHGYDRADLVQPEPGVARLVDLTTGDVVAPRWTTRCGRPPRKPTVSEFRLTRRVLDCEPFQEPDPGPTEVFVGLDREACDELGIAEFSVRRNGITLGPVPCDENLVEDGVPKGQFAVFELLGFEAGAQSPRVGGLCTGTALPGIRTRASCGPISRLGGLAVELDEVYRALDLECGAPVEELVVTLGDSDSDPLQSPAPSCHGSTHFGGLTPGSYEVVISVQLLGESEPRRLECGAAVEPGLSAQAVCLTD